MGFRTWLTGAFLGLGSRISGTGDWVTDWQYPRGSGIWMAYIQWTGGGAPVGTLYAQINNDSNIPPDATGDITLVLPAGTPGTYGAWPAVAGVAGVATVIIKSPAQAMRIGYTRGGGGAANQFRVVYTIRG